MKSVLKKEIIDRFQPSADYIYNNIKTKIDIAIVAGSGFGEFFYNYELLSKINFKDIPNFPRTTVEGHSGEIMFLNIMDKNCLVFCGRFHFYEGYKPVDVASQVIVSYLLGIKRMIFTNASGGLSQYFQVGDCVIISDTINLLYKNDGELFIENTKTHEIFSKQWIDRLCNTLEINHIPYQKGTYLSTKGPTYETPAEIRFFRIIGADCVGMSTILEASVAKKLSIESIGISLITNKLYEVRTREVSHDEVMQASKMAAHKIKSILESAIAINND